MHSFRIIIIIYKKIEERENAPFERQIVALDFPFDAGGRKRKDVKKKEKERKGRNA